MEVGYIPDGQHLVAGRTCGYLDLGYIVPRLDLVQRIAVEEIRWASTHIDAVDHNSEDVVTDSVCMPACCDLRLVSKFAIAATEILNILSEWMRLWEL